MKGAKQSGKANVKTQEDYERKQRVSPGKIKGAF